MQIRVVFGFRIRAVTFLGALFSLVATSAAAQDAPHDVLRGRVRAPDSSGVRNATVSVLPANAPTGTRPAITRSDSTGSWTLQIPVSAPLYAVTVTALGYVPAKTTVARGANGQAAVANVTLSRAVVQLGGVTVTESRRRPPPREGTGIPQDQAAAERFTDNAPGAVAAVDQGNLAAIAASVPGVSLIPDLNGGPPSFSVLGLSSDQNSVTLNGMQFTGGDIPRDAISNTRVSSASYDVSRGGFSGGQLAIQAFSGGNFHQRLGHVTLDAPQLQVTDAVGRQLGSRFANLQISGNATGPIIYDKLFYSAAVQGGRRSSDSQSLLSSDVFALQRVGVSGDSVNHFLTSVGRLGVPFNAAAGQRERDNASFLARIDMFQSQTLVGNIVASVRQNKSSALFLGPTAVPGHGGDETSVGGDVTGTVSALFHKNILSDLRVGGHYNRTKDTPYINLPDARVLVSSRLDDGTTGVTALQFGGNSQLPRDVRSSGVELFEQVSWLSESGTHRFRLTANVRNDAFTQDQYPNQRGTYVFNSLADLDANRPVSFSRNLLSPQVSASALNSAFSLGDSWRPTGRSQILYGARIEGIKFGSTPAYNSAVESAFGVRTDNTPSEVHVSPRVGIAWGLGSRGTAGLPGAPLYFLRGGVGEFRNSTAATLIAPAMRATGLADAVRQIQCVGSAVPTPDWSAFAQNIAAIPTTCADGAGSSFASTQPNVYLIGPGFQAQRSWRGNLSVSGPIVSKWIVYQVEGIYSNNLHQQSPLDLNFNPVTRFSLADEGGRPVYAQSSSIVPGSGGMTNRDSRLNPLFGSVTELTSNLRSISKQVIVTLTPLQFIPGFTWNLSYVRQSVRDEVRGYSGTTAGNPLDVEWGRSPLDSRQQVNGSITFRFRDAFSLALWSRFSSGTPFTPVVAGDINGDGLSNDRAFVFSPTSGDSAIRAGMSALLSGANTRVRDCLTSQSGRIAARGSCEGPWTATTNAVLTLNPEKLGAQNRVTLTLSLANVPAGLDELLHGSNRLQGWGQSSFSDNTLLQVRGFDPVTNRFKYEVNQRFGDTRLTRTGIRSPFMMTLEARVQLGTLFVDQAIDQAMAPGRTRGTDKLSPAQLQQRAMNSVFNPLGTLLTVKDSLSIITKEQLQQLSALQRKLAARQDSIWLPVVAYLAEQPKDYDRKAVTDRVMEAQQTMFESIVEGMREVKTILSPQQIAELPPFMLLAFDEKTLMLTRPSRNFFPNY